MTHCKCCSQQSGRPREAYSLTPGSAHSLCRTHSHTVRAVPFQLLGRARAARTEDSSFFCPWDRVSPASRTGGPSQSSLTADGTFLPGTAAPSAISLRLQARRPCAPPGKGTAHTRIPLSSPRCPGSHPSPRPGPARRGAGPASPVLAGRDDAVLLGDEERGAHGVLVPLDLAEQDGPAALRPRVDLGSHGP